MKKLLLFTALLYSVFAANAQYTFKKTYWLSGNDTFYYHNAFDQSKAADESYFFTTTIDRDTIMKPNLVKLDSKGNPYWSISIPIAGLGYGHTSVSCYYDNSVNLDGVIMVGGEPLDGLNHYSDIAKVNAGGILLGGAYLKHTDPIKFPVAVKAIQSIGPSGPDGFAFVGYDMTNNGFVFKTDASLNMIWDKGIINLLGWRERLDDIVQTSDYGFVAVGSAGDCIQVCKISASGTIVWNKQLFMSGKKMVGKKITRQVVSGVETFLVGGEVDNNDIALVKLISTGTVIWGREFVTPSQIETISGLHYDNAGQVCLSGNADNDPFFIGFDANITSIVFGKTYTSTNPFSVGIFTRDGGFAGLTGKGLGLAPGIIKTDAVGDSYCDQETFSLPFNSFVPGVTTYREDSTSGIYLVPRVLGPQDKRQIRQRLACGNICEGITPAFHYVEIPVCYESDLVIPSPCGTALTEWYSAVINPDDVISMSSLDLNNIVLDQYYRAKCFNEDGCLLDEYYYYINVRDPEFVTIPVAVCSGNSKTLTVSNPDAVSFEWSDGSTSSSLNITPTDDIVYTVKCYDANGCFIGEYTYVVDVINNVVIGVTQNINLCWGNTTSIGVFPSAGNTYLWSPTGQTISSITVNPLSNTSYNLKVYDVNGCLASDLYYNIIVSPQPVTSTNVNFACIGEGVWMNASCPPGSTQVNWYKAPNFATSLSIANMVSFPMSPGGAEYHAICKDANGCVLSDRTYMLSPYTGPATIEQLTFCYTGSPFTFPYDCPGTGGTQQWFKNGVSQTPNLINGPGNYQIKCKSAVGNCDVHIVNITVTNEQPCNFAMQCYMPNSPVTRPSCGPGATMIWFKNGGPYMTGTNTITPNGPGLYTFNCTYNGITIKYYIYLYDCSTEGGGPGAGRSVSHDVQEIAKENESQIAPNPTSGLVAVSVKVEGNYTIKLSDQYGKQLEHIKGTGSGTIREQLDMSGYTPGMYYVHITANDKTEIHKLVFVR